ncbi:CRISPR-associated protein Cst1/CRISPR-associated protein Cas5t [Hydrogenivirga caldilitoris]|uniref:CRISPR-associated protein Cst1/CRISPR-associated protein Cas5t n=1 Tax=Hydrogenivirga caldilitoris TaxID=246264 RepID=A0A497XR84_9AQUI|nr:type I-B CRISPR-associated protein Cas8b1/Cst1 [Hydrogenivirga caldilitoris]RLJ70700.1 CRISPR-associated protein Cst1/CRISPR-associated protein Cas5t [Hydrogenivirga caldilitoris]
MGVRFYADNWLTASAGVGLLRVLEKIGVNWKPFVNGNVIEIPEDTFQGIAEHYTEYILADFTLENLENMLEKGKINVYNNIVLQKIGDFYSNSPLTNPSSTKRANKRFEEFYEKEKDSRRLYDFTKTVVRDFVREQLDELLKSKRSNKLCFFCQERKAYIKKDKVKTFDATNFTPLGASPETLENLFWNGRSNMYLCPECEIFLYFSAFGFTRTPRRTYLFVYAPDLGTAYNLNNILAQEGTKSVISRTIVEASKMVEGRKAEWILENIYIVEIEKVGDAQANIYTLNISAKLARAIKEMINEYPPLFDDIFDSFIEYVYSGRSLYEFLFSILSGFFYSERYKNLSGRKSMLIRKGKGLDYLPKNLTFFIKFQEVLNMEDKEKISRQVNWAYGEGLSLRKAYFDELGNDKARKKIESISYRILEAVRRRDTDAFEQNLIRAYLEVEREIPYVFVEALKDGGFNRIAYAFLIGLNGKDRELSEVKESE